MITKTKNAIFLINNNQNNVYQFWNKFDRAVMDLYEEEGRKEVLLSATLSDVDLTEVKMILLDECKTNGVRLNWMMPNGENHYSISLRKGSVVND